MAIFENRRTTPQYQMNGARRNIELGLTPPAGQTPTDPQASNPNFGNPNYDQPRQTQDVAPVEDPYISMFRSNMVKSRADVQRQFDAALQDINANEMRSTAAVQTLPKMLQDIYAPAAQQIDTQNAASKASQMATGLQSFTPAGAGVEPVKAAMASSQASRAADVPLLQLGVGQTFANQRSGLSRAQMQENAALTDRQSQFDMEQAKQKSDWDHQLALAGMQNDQQSARDERLHGYDLENLGVKLGLAKKDQRMKQRQEGRAVLGTYSPGDSTPERAKAIRQYDPAQWSELAKQAKKMWQQTHGLQTPGESPAWTKLAPLAGPMGAYAGSIGNLWGTSQTRNLSPQERIDAIARGNPNRARIIGALRYLYGNRK
jgi:hypothetical protein